jgi:phenylacetate-CoA ligase
MSIYKRIWSIGARYRNPSVNKLYKELKETERYPLHQLEDLQYKKLKETLIFAEKYSTFYKRKFAEVAFNPETDFLSLSDIQKVPVVTKNDLLQHNKEIHTGFSFKKVFKAETSGTSGQVLKFDKDEYWDSFNRAAFMRGYSWYGVNPWDKNGYFWGYNINPKKRLKVRLQDFLQNRFRLFSYDEKNIRNFVKKLKSAKYLSGYSSMIYEVAKKINREKINTEKFKLKMIKGTSEKIFESYQTEVKKAFGLKIISEYGAAESGIIAFECPYGNMHINMEGVFVEEENGEIIVTNLVARSFPTIRYKLGDYITLKPKDFTCACGKQHPIVENVTGRVGNLIVGSQKTYPSLTFYYVFKNLAIEHGIELNYQAHQYEPGKLLVLIEQKINEKQLSLLVTEFEKYFKKDLIVEIKDTSVLHFKNGKLKDFISHI